MDANVVAHLNEQLAEALARRDDADSDVKRFRGALKALDVPTNGGNGKGRGYDPRKLAGEKNITDVSEYLRFKGEARQADIVSDLGKNPSTVSCALQALQDDGDATTDGKQVNRSKLWKWTGAPARKTRARRGSRSKATA